MEKKTLKKIVSLVLAVVMLMSLVACGGDSKKQNGDKGNLDWLNTDGTLPIVKEGTEKTLKIAVVMYSDSGDAESILTQFEKAATRHPYSCEIEGERELLARVRGKAKS